jgi:hypothetical protein
MDMEDSTPVNRPDTDQIAVFEEREEILKVVTTIVESAASIVDSGITTTLDYLQFPISKPAPLLVYSN